MKCRKDSKKHCMSCRHYDYCDRANRCNGDCHLCDDYDCENNPSYKKNKQKEDIIRTGK
jgi:hypothetical protein